MKSVWKRIVGFAWRRRVVLALVGVLLVATFLRAVHLGVVPFRADEFLDINATVGYARTGVWQAWDHNMEAPSARINPASDARAWLYRWQVAQLFRVAPPTEAVARSVSVLWGVITVGVIYAFAVSLTRVRMIGLVAAAIAAVSVSLIEVSRTLRMYAMFVPIYMMFSWAVYHAMTARARDTIARKIVRVSGVHPWYGIAALALGVAAFALHQLAGMIIAIAAVFAFVMAFVAHARGVHWRDNHYIRIIFLGGAATLGAVYFAPEAIAPLRAGIAPWENHWSYVTHVLRDYWHPLIAIALYVIGIAGLWFSPYRRQSDAAAWIDTTVGVTLFCAIFLWARNVGPQYIIFIQPFIIIGIAAGIYVVARWVRARCSVRRAAVIVAVSALVFVPWYGYFFAENNTYHITSRAEQPDYRKVFTYVRKHLRDGDVFVTRNFRNYYWSGAGVKVYDFGSERAPAVLAAEGKVAKITLPYLQSIMAAHPSGWVIFSDNDEVFISTAARRFMQRVLTRVSHSAVRGNIYVYRWGIYDE